MSGFFTGLGFLHPWMLAALAGLPVLWWILRLMPPAPRHIAFAPIRFLQGLIPQQRVASHTPWWILLLRCLIVAMLIAALAGPVRTPPDAQGHDRPVRIVMDNGWSAAGVWDKQVRRAEDIIAQAARHNQPIDIATTAPLPAQAAPLYQGPLTPGDATALVRSFAPVPWPAMNAALRDIIQQRADAGPIDTHWLGTGLDEGGYSSLAALLQEQGTLYYYTPDGNALPVLLRFESTPENPYGVRVDVAGDSAIAKDLEVEAVSLQGRVLDRQTLTTKPGSHDGTAAFDLPPDLRGQLAKIQITGHRGAGSVLLMDDLSRRRNVGILSSLEAGDTKPFIDALFYLTRALSPYADITTGDTEELLSQGQDVLILTDNTALPPEVLERLEGWLQEGGLILRFAGPNMTDGQTLTPVPIRIGQRALDGTLSWEKPQKIAPFPAGTPLSDVPLNEEIIIRTQVLADPAYDLTGKVWATLEDGTPLITAEGRGKGLLVMVHTAAGPEWSDLPLSGLYVTLLRRIVGLSGGVNMQEAAEGVMKALSVMDGYGTLQSPGRDITIPAKSFDMATPSSATPPGLYGRAGYIEALTLGDHLPPLKTAPSPPGGAVLKGYGHAIQVNYTPLLLGAALSLFLIDWLILIVMSRRFHPFAWRRAAAGIGVLLCVMFPAQNTRAAEADDVRLAGDMYLAYVKSGRPAIDQTAQEGLESLARVLSQRTSVEPAGVKAINPAQDDLSFFPIIYWPVNEDVQALDSAAILNIQRYLDHGGTILFDTRGRTTQALQTVLHPLSIPALIPIAKNHVLNKTFYLIDSYPGRYMDDTLWIEENSAPGRDGVSSVIIGSNDWAAAWSSPREAMLGESYLTGQTREQELALRFGVNLVMYALTGNYKADQVHLPHILQRLDQ